MAEKSFIKGALVLTVAGVVAKMMGALYRIPFARIVGEEGSAIYGLVYPVYNLLLALSTAGIPLAISKLIAEREEQGYSQESLRIFKVALLLLSAVGLSVGVIIFINADWIAANVLHEPKAAWSLRALAPAMIFSCMQAVFRGYFQGLQQMVPTALSQITEQFIRVGVIMAVIFTLAGFGAETVAAGASFGASVGGFAALSLIVMLFLRHQRKQGVVDSKTPELAESNGKIIRQVLALAIPISIGSLVLPLMQSIDSILVLPRLEAGGMNHLQAMGQFAYLSTYVAPIINLPFIITTAVAASLVPAISEALSAGKFDFVRKNFQSAMQLGILIVLPAAAGLGALAEPICILLYDQPAAGVALLWSAPIVLVVGVYQISSGTLQGMGKAMIPMYSLLIGAAIKIALTYMLTPIAFLGVRGAAIGTVVGFAVAALHNLYHVTKGIGKEWFTPTYHVVKPLISAAVMVVLVILSYQILWLVLGSNGTATLLSIIIGAGSYFAVLLAIGGVQVNVLRQIPKVGNKVANLLLKLKLVREE